jgi:hypothetical protein
LNAYGWVGFRYPILMFGYSIDGGDIVFNSYPSAPGDAVIAAGGKQAARFNIIANISGLSVGDHTITYVALVDYDGGTPVNILSFTVKIVARPTAPEGLDIPEYNSDGKGFLASYLDHFKIDGTEFKFSSGTKIPVQKGAKELSFAGWIGFEGKIDAFGYAIDGGEAKMVGTAINPEQAVIDAAGEYAQRYVVKADISSLEAGVHVFDLLIRVNTGSQNELLKMITVTIDVK